MRSQYIPWRYNYPIYLPPQVIEGKTFDVVVTVIPWVFNSDAAVGDAISIAQRLQLRRALLERLLIRDPCKPVCGLLWSCTVVVYRVCVGPLWFCLSDIDITVYIVVWDTLNNMDSNNCDPPPCFQSAGCFSVLQSRNNFSLGRRNLNHTRV